jgi:phosphoadenosine phosphosulfate reductase
LRAYERNVSVISAPSSIPRRSTKTHEDNCDGQESEEGSKEKESGEEKRWWWWWWWLMASALSETQRALETVRATTSKVLVAYSDGKDARVVMDLACRTFDHIEGFFMYYVPGISFLEHAIEEAQDRWKVRIHQVPHWSSIMALKSGVYCNPAPENEYVLPNMSLWNIYASMIKMTGIPVILTGFKRSDSNSRRRFMGWSESNKQIVHPVAGWKKREVLQYLTFRSIPIPASSGAATTGVDLSDTELLWLHANHPEDFKVLCRYFPFAEAVIRRKEFFGA